MVHSRCSSFWAFLRFGLCVVISLGLICGGFISARASDIPTTLPHHHTEDPTLFDVEEVEEYLDPIVYYDGGFSFFGLDESDYTCTFTTYLWDATNLVEVLQYSQNYSIGSNVVTSAQYHRAIIYINNLLGDMGVGTLKIDFTYSIETTNCADEPCNITLIDSSGNNISSLYYAQGSNTAIFEGDFSELEQIKIDIFSRTNKSAFDVTISSLEFEEESSDTKNIFELLKEFCGSFFTKIKDSFKTSIVDSLKSLFIPEDGYFEDLFQRMQDFFSEKLGALYAPIDIFISILEGFSNVSGSDPGIHFPGLKWEDTYIIEPQTVSLSAIAKDFPDLQEKIYFATNVIMVGSVLWLLQVKLREVLKN